MKIIFTIISILIFFSNTSFARTGKGPLKLSKNTMETVLMYMYGAGNKKYSDSANRKNNPTIMAVSESGYSYMYSYCPIVYHDGCTPPNTGRIIKKCEKYSEGSPCYIFARKRTIVWKNGSEKVRIKKKDLKNPLIVARKIKEAGFYDGDLSELTGIDIKTGQLDENKKMITKKKKKTTSVEKKQTSLVEELETLSKLFENGSLTEEEFDKAKKKLLNN